MIIDARSLSLEETIATEVCIIGAGPAGLTLAREFMNQKFHVCLVESGGFDHDQELQSLCEGHSIGDPYPELQEGRRRRFGGTSHAWEASIDFKKFGWRCLPLDEIDFEQRDWFPYSGWPFTRSDLDPFYSRAHQVCQIGPLAYGVEDWQEGLARPLAFKGNRVVTTMSQYASRTPFTHEYREEVKRARNITTLLHATVVNIEMDEISHTVTRLQVACLEGKHFWVSAKVVILATGGIENARLLLNSNQQQQAGLGNQNDLVGRFFMERPIVSCGFLIPKNQQLFDQTSLYDILKIRGVPVMARVKLAEEVMRHEHLLNNGAQLFPRPLPRQREATLSLRSLFSSLKQAKLSKNTLNQLGKVINGSDYIIPAAFWAAIRRLPGLHRGDWSYLPYEKRRFSMFEVIYQIEQAPDPNNRVTLSRDCDRLGLRKVELHWRLNDIDRRTIQRVGEIWAEEFGKAGLGELQLNKNLKFNQLAMHHHMGTTRMHIDPKQGVVDANCQVHGITNLFIAGSSVFPTAGYANPTLTIIALSLRLADHIKTLIGVPLTSTSAYTVSSSIEVNKEHG